MRELINGRTPEKIRFNIMECAHGHCLSECPYDSSDECVEDLLDDALALIERLESERDAALAKVPRWISVEERLPEHEHEVLVYTDRYGGRTEFAYYVRHLEAWYQNCCLLIPNVTHWMPLPEPPKEEEK